MPTIRLHWIPAVALALLATPAVAGSVCTDLVPPARYLEMPRPEYTLDAIDNIYTMHRVCMHETRLGCSDRRIMTVFYLASLADDPVRFRCFLRHEEAHLNGWPGDHPS